MKDLSLVSTPFRIKDGIRESNTFFLLVELPDMMESLRVFLLYNQIRIVSVFIENFSSKPANVKNLRFLAAQQISVEVYTRQFF